MLPELPSFRRTIEVARATGAAVYFVHTRKRGGGRGGSQGCFAYPSTRKRHITSVLAEQYRTPRGYCYHTYPSPKDLRISRLCGADFGTMRRPRRRMSFNLSEPKPEEGPLRTSRAELVLRLGWDCLRRVANGVCHWLDLPTSPPQYREDLWHVSEEGGYCGRKRRRSCHHRSIDQEAPYSR